MAPTTLVTVTGALGLVAAAAVALAPLRVVRARPGLLGAAAATPPLLSGLAFLLLRGASAPIGLDLLLQFPDYPSALSAQAVMVPALQAIAASAAFLLVPFTIWQAITWARASRRQIGERVAAAVSISPWLLWTLLVVKLAWLLAGYADVLPDALGGWSPEWTESIEDGLIGWAAAIALTAVAGWWLARPNRLRMSRVGFRRAALLIAIGFASWSLMMGALGLLSQIAMLAPESSPIPPLAACHERWVSAGLAYAVLCLQDALIGWLVVAQVGTILVALVAGIVLLARRRVVPVALFLVAVGLWTLPRAANATRELLFGDASTGTDALGTVELATLDTAITLMVAVLAVGWWRRRGPAADPWALAIVLVVSTLLARASLLILPGWSVAVFYLALVFPLLYELGFDSEELNEPKPDRAAQLLFAVGLRAGALTVLAVGLGLGIASVGDSDAELTYVLFAPPFAAWLVAAAISARERAVRRWRAGGEPIRTTPAPRLRQAALGLGVGVAGAAVLLTVSTAATPLLAGAVAAPPAVPTEQDADPPSERSRYLEFFSRERTARDEFIALNAELETASTTQEWTLAGSALAVRADEELAWMREHPAAPCYADAWQARDLELRRSADMGRLLVSTADGETPIEDLEAAVFAWVEATDALSDALEGTPEACGIGESAPLAP